jgi:hypothetical protein
MNELSKGLMAAANSPIRAVLTTVIGGVTLALLLWIASLLSHMSYAMPNFERRLAGIETRQEVVGDHMALTREGLAVLRREVALMQEELRLLRRASYPRPTDN